MDSCFRCCRSRWCWRKPLPRTAGRRNQWTPASSRDRVINATTGEPVGRVRLFLRPVSGALPAAGQTTPASYTTTTGADGKFAMKDLAPGSYRLSARRNGFVSAEYGAKRTSGTGTILELEKGQSRAGIEFKLTPHSVIAGRVIDETGEPVAGASVRAIRYGYQYGRGRKQAIQTGSATTNDLGEYRLFGLAPGRYFVVARDVSTLSGERRRKTPPQTREPARTTCQPSIREPPTRRARAKWTPRPGLRCRESI